MRIDRIKKILRSAFFLALMICCIGTTAQAAAPFFTNSETGYRAVIEDDAGLLENTQELKEVMEQITAYGNVCAATASAHSGSTNDCAKEYFRALFGTESGTVMLIDMQEREIYIFSDGAIYKTLRKKDALIITDNVYQYAAEGEYSRCMKEAFAQILTKLEGGRLSSGMRLISSAVMALMTALLLTFGAAKLSTTTGLADEKELIGQMKVGKNMKNHHRTLAMREYKIVSHSDSSGGSSGGGGGGGSSGGGGGHGF